MADNGNTTAGQIPLVSFEHYMYADDRKELPMTFFMVFHFAGSFEQTRFEAAVGDSLKSHPILQSTINKSAKNCLKNLHWVVQPGALPWIDWSEDGRHAYPENDPFLDIQQEMGIRLFLSQQGGTAKLMVQAHHSATTLIIFGSTRLPMRSA